MPTKFFNLDTDSTLSSNSDYLIPSQKAIKTAIDNSKIESQQLIKDQNSGNLMKMWVGTADEYAAIETKDELTIYIIKSE